MPTLRLRSARPRVIMRPVSVTIPAPSTTPRIPTRGRFESSEGIPPATFLAICTFVGGASAPAAVAITNSALVFCTHGCRYRKSRTQLRGERRRVKRNLDGNSLHDLGEVSCSVVWRKQRKLRAARGRDLQNFAAQRLPGESVDGD